MILLSKYKNYVSVIKTITCVIQSLGPLWCLLQRFKRKCLFIQVQVKVSVLC